MLLSYLFTSPQMFMVMALAIVFALTIHEFSHSAAATYLGDNTSKYSGRLTLNPLAHLDVWVTLILVIAGFGWGRPVPINTYNLRWRRWGEAAVSIAGPLSNFISVVIFVIILNMIAPFFSPDNLLIQFLLFLIFVNLILGVFNLIPIPPLDGSKVLFAFLPPRYDDFKRKLTINGIWILILLVILGRISSFDVFGAIINFFLDIVYFFI